MSFDFPITWEHPSDEGLFFQHERSHFPGQVKPLDFALNVKGMEYGFNQAACDYNVPLRMYDRYINTYLYEAIVPIAPETNDTNETLLKNTMPNLSSMWSDKWLPEIKQHLAYWESYNLTEATLIDLYAHLDETYQRLNRIWEIHFLLFFPMMVSISQFEELYTNLFGTEETFGVYQLLTGFKNKTIEANQALWQLSSQVRAVPSICQLLTETPLENIMVQLSESVEGQRFFESLSTYLAEYGKRSNEWSIDAPFWIENPTPVLKNLRDYIRSPERDLVAETEKIIVQREQAVAQAKAQLKNYSQAVSSKFETALESAQVSSFLTEEHFFWIEGHVNYRLRQVCLAIGRQLAKIDIIEQADDIFYFFLNELQVLRTASSLSPQHHLIQARKSTEAQFAQITPPDRLGTPPDGSGLPSGDLVSQTLAKFYGAPPAQSASKQTLQGLPASPGMAQGTVKIVKSLVEADKLEPGDILVSNTTAPPWTALFVSISALVTDTGGVLSHGAIVAREYNIPAVVGVGVATATLKDGQHIEVNGNTGLIRLISAEV